MKHIINGEFHGIPVEKITGIKLDKYGDYVEITFSPGKQTTGFGVKDAAAGKKIIAELQKELTAYYK